MTSPMHSPLQSPLQPVMRSPLEFRRRGGFNIASTNPSAYYDRTNLATLFQNNYGDTPVDAAAQPIGLGLDQSQGLALGPEMVTNGDFSAGAAGWSTNDASVTADTGALVFAGTAAAYIGSQNLAGAPQGSTYKLSIDYSITSGRFHIYLGNNPAKTYLSGSGNLTLYAQMGAVPDIKVQAIDFPASGTFDNISVKLLAGNHQSQATAGKRPLTAGSPIYADFDAVDDDLVATFPASLGSGCTVCRSLPGTGASITTGVTLTATYTDNVDAHALLIYTAAQWAALDAGQIANITTWLNAKAGV